MAQLQPQPSIRDSRTGALMQIIARLDALDLSPILVYRIDSVPDSALPWLAWQFDIQSPFWQLLDNPGRRVLLKEAIALHAARGTPWAIKTALASLGYPGATIQEGQNSWGGSGWPTSEGWAVNRIIVPLPPGGVGPGIAGIIECWNFFKPARSWLDTVHLISAPLSDTLKISDGTLVTGTSDELVLFDMLLTNELPDMSETMVRTPRHDSSYQYTGIEHGPAAVGLVDGALVSNGVPIEEGGD
jgi:phage tail P2-like protein